MNLDLNILKSITTNSKNAIEFSFTYNHHLFKKEIQPFAKLIIEYIRAYRSIPTKRVLKEKYDSDELVSEIIDDGWDKLDEYEYNDNEYKFDLEQIKKRYEKNVVESIKYQLESSDFGDIETTVKGIGLNLQRIYAVRSGRTFKQQTVKDYLEEFENEYEARKNATDSNNAILTHFSGIDYVTDGMKPSELLIIGGETNSGKSMWLNSLAKQMWLQENDIFDSANNFSQGANILYFSLEMPYEECFARFLASIAGVPQKSILNGSLDAEQIKKVNKAKEFIEKYPYEFEIVDFPRGLSIHEMEMRYNDAYIKYKPDVVSIDYLQLMNDPNRNKEPDWLKLGGLAGDVHEFARAFNVIAITAVQLTDIKRQSKGKDDGEDKKIGLHRIGRSSLIMHHANLGIQIETRQNEDQYVNTRYHIIKNRKGPLVHGASLRKNFSHGCFLDMPYVPSGGVSAFNKEDISERVAELYRKKYGEL